MSKKKKFDVDDAYALETPADSIRLYGEWAPTYDSDLIERIGYVVHQRVAEILLRQRSLIDGAVLDVGCGTGLVGVKLRERGIDVIDGVDISPQMLDEAGKKTTENGDPVYRNLFAADLTDRLDIPDNKYAGLRGRGTGDQVEQCCFARPTRADDGDRLAMRYLQMRDLQRKVSLIIGKPEIPDFNHQRYLP